MLQQTRNMIVALAVVAALAATSGGEARAQTTRVLDVRLVGQETSMWCWATVTQMSTEFTGSAKVRQCAEANTRFTRTDCCATPANCVFGGWPEYAKWGFNSVQTADFVPLTWAQLKAEINANRPVNFSWGWTAGGGHIMVANGFYESGATQNVWVSDPWPVGTGATRWIPYTEYVQGADHVHWKDYSGIARSSGSAWAQVAGGAKDVGVGIAGSVWLIGNGPVAGGYGIYKWNGAGWTNVAGGAVRIAVNPIGEPWIVNDAGTIYRGTTAGAWTQMPGAAKDIGIGADGSVWIIGNSPGAGGYGISKWNGAGWTQVGGSAVRIAVDASGEPWIVNDAGTIYRRSAGSWTQLPGAAKDIGVGGDGSVWIIGTTAAYGGYSIHKWNGTGWNTIAGAATNISVGSDGRPWITCSDGLIFRWQ